MKPAFGAVLLFAFGAAGVARAQGLTMQMSNGWKFTFSGNVNAFAVYTADANAGQKNFNIRTGLLPGFAVFEASGKEAGLDLGVHVGFAPEIQNAGTFNQGGNVQIGTQIDMRQFYLTVGMQNGWKLLAGRELGIFQRQNILNDMTLYGTGAQGGVQGQGTTLGRIGYGYIYPNFNAQFSLSSPADTNHHLQATFGLFQPGRMAGHPETELPRLEGEFTFRIPGSPNILLWAGGMWQNAKTAPGGTGISAVGGTVGAKVSQCGWAGVLSAYTGKGLGTTLFLAGDEIFGGLQTKSDGGYLQVTLTPSCGTTTFGLSYGISRLKDNGGGSIGQLSSYTGGVYHQWTKSLKVVGEVTREVNAQGGAISIGTGPNRLAVSAGLMLFF
jgi:hypothetical protein